MNSQQNFPDVLGAAERTHREMIPVLMNPEQPGPRVHYYMVRGDGNHQNITAWLPGKIGNEYIKAYGHYHIKDFTEIYTVIQGEGLMIMQERNKNENGEYSDKSISTFCAVHMKRGESISIPPLWGHGMVNIGDTWLITLDDSPIMKETGENASKPLHADYGPITKMGGFAFYVVDSRDSAGRHFTLHKNPNYDQLPTPIIFDNVNLFEQYIADKENSVAN